MEYLTGDQVRDWANDMLDTDLNSFFCEHCLTRLIQADEGLWYCPNEMCLYDEQGEINLKEN